MTGTSKTFGPASVVAVNTMVVFSGENDTCEYSHSLFVRRTGAPPIFMVAAVLLPVLGFIVGARLRARQ